MANSETVLAAVPPSLRNANLAIFLYGIALVTNAAAYGLRFGLWLGFVQSLGFLFVAILVGGSLLTRKPGAWWIALVASGLVALRGLIGLGAYLVVRAEGHPLDVQRPIFQAVGAALSVLAIILLLSRASRGYFKQPAGFAGSNDLADPGRSPEA